MTVRFRPSRVFPGLYILAVLAAVGMSGCSGPNPDTPAGQTEIAGQKCTVCRLQNPGDNAACYAICMQRIEDQAAGKAYQH